MPEVNDAESWPSGTLLMILPQHDHFTPSSRMLSNFGTNRNNRQVRQEAAHPRMIGLNRHGVEAAACE